MHLKACSLSHTCLAPGLGTLKLLGAGTAGFLRHLSLPLCGLSTCSLQHGSFRVTRLLVNSGLLKHITQEKEPGGSHTAFYDLASEVMQHHSGQAGTKVHLSSRIWSIDPSSPWKSITVML